MNKAISGFSKLSKEEKIKWIANEYFSTPTDAVALLKNYWNSDEKLQQLHDEFIENTITNFYIPLELPLIFINGKYSTIPWPLKKAQWLQLPQKQLNFGLRAAALRLPSITEKIGQVHFMYREMFPN
jgi:hydroxymethylglutaryl-CoA reductase